MDQSILVQYSEVMEEIKDLRERIRKLDRFLSDPPVVLGYGPGNQEGRDHRSDQDYGGPCTGVPAEGKDLGTVQGDAGREGGRAPGADL